MGEERTGEKVKPTEGQKQLTNLIKQYEFAVGRDRWRHPLDQRVAEATVIFQRSIVEGLTSEVIQPEDLATAFAETIRYEQMYKYFSDSGRDDD